MTLEKLREQRAALLMQRAALKDQVELVERQLGQVVFAIQALEEAAKQPEPEPSNDE